jgi:kynurenine formamidase
VKSVRLIEVSHPVREGMKTYPGLPEPRAEVLLDYDTSREKYGGLAEFFIASLHLCGNTGTYVDAPVHRFRGGQDLASLPLARLAHVPIVVVDASGARAVDAPAFEGLDVEDKAVLVRTGWSRHFGTEAYFAPNPHLTRRACELLVARGAAIVGIDSLNIDDTADLARPAHTVLLGAGVPVLEHLTHLDALDHVEGFLHAVPIAWVGGATFPVRAYVVAPELGPSAK